MEFENIRDDEKTKFKLTSFEISSLEIPNIDLGMDCLLTEIEHTETLQLRSVPAFKSYVYQVCTAKKKCW